MASSTQEKIKDTTRFRRAFVPTLAEIGVLTAGSFLFLLAINSFSVFRTIGGENYTQVSELIQSYVEKILAPTNNQQGSQILTVLFWMFIGIIVYLIIAFVIGLINTYNSDVHWSKRLVLPQGSNKNNLSHEFIARLAVRLLATMLFLYWIYLILAGFLPYASITFLENITNVSLNGILMIGWSVVVLACSIFVSIILARCIVLRERVFNSR